MREIHVSVLIVGGGTVGLHLAMELGWRNVDCLLVNERASTPDHPKGSTINSRSMEHMRRLGIRNTAASGDYANKIASLAFPDHVDEDSDRGARARYRPSACPGGRAPHCWIAERHSLYDWLGPDFNLLRLGRDAPDADPLTTAARRLGIPLTVVTVDDPGILELYERPLALVRPDQHVAWRGAALPDDPDALLETVAALRA